MEPFHLVGSESGVRVELLPVMDLRAAEPLKATLQEAIGRGGEVEIAASAVERFSTPCLQVLLAAAAAMDKAGITFKVTAPSDAFIGAIDDLGLFPVIMKWKVE